MVEGVTRSRQASALALAAKVTKGGHSVQLMESIS
ncbi:hypothetical protein YSA_02873 [Pseudomonas putida ND6]|uniref:Uncharacterized protein n=1 Tax=Pseudomonas putida ND6 TaxID=231023 RepID=I3US57_PSEPU|nr:hypothetical protein YSA_02873 [Pseudomonas putida ND6]